MSGAEPDAQGAVTCPKCGIRLKPRASPPAVPPSPPAPPPPAAAPPPAPVVPPPYFVPPAPAAPAPRSAPVPVPQPGGATLEAVLDELRIVRGLQEQMLGMLRARPSSASPSPGIGADDDADNDGPLRAAPPPPPPPMRTRRRKTVLLIDDDAATRAAAAAALESAQVPTRAVGDGNAAIAAIAEEKPDVLVIEIDMGGVMPGKDVINMIKATMEWVDVPIILYTRAPVTGQKEAQTIHGGDELVPKGAGGGPQALVTRVISVFRR